MKPEMSKVNGVNGTKTHEGNGTLPGQNSYVTQVASDRHQATAQKLHLRIGTWNVRTLYRAGQLENVVHEMNRAQLDILGLCETRWPGNGRLRLENHTMLYSGGEQHAKGVALIMTKKVGKSVVGCWTVSERVMIVKFKCQPVNINIIQVYAPTSDAPDKDIQLFYEDLNKASSTCKSPEVRIVMGDFNAKVGKHSESGVTGVYGLGNKNEQGETLIEWCRTHYMSILNTTFNQHKRRLYTWKSPGDLFRNQIDYICINQRFRNSVKNCKTLPGADCNSDHILLVMQMICKLKKIKSRNRRRRLNISALLQNPQLASEFIIEIKNRFSALDISEQEETSAEEDWKEFEIILTETAEKILPKKEPIRKRKWMTNEIMELNTKRRKYKRDSCKYKETDKKVRMKCKEAKEKYMNDQCEEIESLQKRNISLMYNKLRTMYKRKTRAANNAIKSKSGKIMFEKEDIKKRWVEYIEELFDDNSRPDRPVDNPELDGHSILESEVKAALRSMKNNKAPGNDNITKEMIEACGDIGINKLVTIMNKIYESGYIPPNK